MTIQCDQMWQNFDIWSTLLGLGDFFLRKVAQQNGFLGYFAKWPEFFIKAFTNPKIAELFDFFRSLKSFLRAFFNEFCLFGHAFEHQ